MLQLHRNRGLPAMELRSAIPTIPCEVNRSADIHSVAVHLSNGCTFQFILPLLAIPTMSNPTGLILII